MPRRLRAARRSSVAALLAGATLAAITGAGCHGGEGDNRQGGVLDQVASVLRNGGHFVAGQVVGSRFVAAGVFDGAVVFDGDGADWTYHVTPMGECVRLLVADDVAICSSRGPQLSLYAFDPAVGRVTGERAVTPIAQPPVALDGFTRL